MSTRADIAAAMSTVNGVQGHAYRPGTPKTGDAWPLLTGYSRVDGWLTKVQRVVVFLPQDEKKASEWIDSHVDALVDALTPLAYVERLDPTDGPAQGQFSLTITLRSE